MRKYFIQELEDEIEKINKNIQDISVPTLAAEYTIPMLIECAISLSNNIVDSTPRFSTADHISVFKAMSILMSKLKSYKKDKFDPYFIEAYSCDSDVMDFLLNAMRKLSDLNSLISINEGYYTVNETDNDIRVGLSRQFRRSAMHIVNLKCEYLSYTERHQNSLNNFFSGDKSTDELVLVALDGKLKELEIFYNGMVQEWDKFMSDFKFSLDDLISFQGFIVYLRGYCIWNKMGGLKQLWSLYCEEYAIKIGDEETFKEMVELYSLSPDQAKDWGIASAFIIMGDWYVYWPFFLSIMDGSLLLMSIFHRKEQNKWSKTLGSYTSRISTYIANSLKYFHNNYIVSEKLLKKIGDIDLAIYDENNKHLLLCEVKTVFDKFRTNYQYENFYSQKINVKKAIKQLKQSKQIILQEIYTLDDIFKSTGLGSPERISLIILSWWDIFDPTIGTDDEEILCCNFKTFSRLYDECCGNITLLVDVINELRSIYCPAKLVEISSFNDNEDIVHVYREMQTDILPAPIKLKTCYQHDKIRDFLKDLPHLPMNWRDQMTEHGEDPETYFFY